MEQKEIPKRSLHTTLAESTVITAIAHGRRATLSLCIAVNQTSQIYESSTLYNWLYNCITAAKSPKIIHTTTHSLSN